MVTFRHLIGFTILLVVFSTSFADEEEYFPRVVLRSPRSIGGIFRRLFGRRKQTVRSGFQGTSQAQQPYNTQSSSYYPSYAGYGSYPAASSAYPSYFSGYPGYGSYGSYPNSYAGSYPGYGGYGSYPAATGAYATYNPTAAASYPVGAATGAPVATPTGGIDFHSVLDQLVRSAGISPNGGDQEASASTIQAKGDTPVFSFKKLYSFPFYLSTDQAQADQGYNLQIPFMKRHIRRMSNDQNKQNQIVNQNYPQNYNLNPQNYLSQYAQQFSRQHNINPAVTAAALAAFQQNQYNSIQSNQFQSNIPESTPSETQATSESQYQPSYYYGQPQAQTQQLAGDQTVQVQSSYSTGPYSSSSSQQQS